MSFLNVYDCAWCFCLICKKQLPDSGGLQIFVHVFLRATSSDIETPEKINQNYKLPNKKTWEVFYFLEKLIFTNVIPLFLNLLEFERTDKVQSTRWKFERSKSIDGSKSSDSDRPKQLEQAERKALMLRRHKNCAIWGFWLMSFMSIHSGSMWFSRLQSNTPSLRMNARSAAVAVGQFARWSARKTPHLINQLAHSCHALLMSVVLSAMFIFFYFFWRREKLLEDFHLLFYESETKINQNLIEFFIKI